MINILPIRRGAGRTILFGAILTVLAIGGTFLLDPYRNFQLATIAATFCAVAGLTLLVGHSGQLSLGHAALMAAGGYGYALTANALNVAGADPAVRFVVSLAAGVLAAGVLGLLLGLAAARLRGPYLAGVTLALVVALPAVASVFPGVFRGDQGLQVPYDGVPHALRTLIALEQWQAWIAVIVAGVTVTALAVLRGGALGLRMRAVRDDETAARLNGVAASQIKVRAFVISALAAGAGGGVLGGLGSIGGAAIGTALIVLLPWLIGTAASAIPMPAELSQRLSGNLPVLVFGALLIVTMLVRPGGLASLRFRPAVSNPKKEVSHVTASSAPADRDPRHGSRPGDSPRRLQHSRTGGS